MNRASRHFVAFTVIAAYGGISFLGHGLHWLAPESGHHHGLELVQCAVHGSSHEHHHHHAIGEHHSHHHHHGDEPGTPCEPKPGDGLSITAGDCVAHLHQCEVCVFLAQARSEPPQLTAAIICPHFSAVVAAVEQPIYLPASLHWHTPRGPPRIG